MNAMQWILAGGIGVVALIALAVFWTLRRMPSDAELEELSRRFPEASGQGDSAES